MNSHCWINTYIKDHTVDSYKIDFTSKLKSICETFHLTQSTENKIDLNTENVTDFESVYKKLPFLLTNNCEILNMNKINKNVIEKFNMFNTSPKTVPILLKEFEHHYDFEIDNDTMLFKKLKFTSGFNCINTGIIFKLKENMVMLVYPTVESDFVYIHPIAIDMIDNGMVHLSIYNTSEDEITADVKCKMFLFHVTNCEETVGSKTVVKTKKSKIVNLEWPEIKNLDIIQDGANTKINEFSYNTNNLVIVPRKRAMMNEHFASLGLNLKRKKDRESINFVFKTTSPYIVSNAMALFSVKGMSKIELIKSDFEVTSYKLLLNGYYSKLQNYKEIVKTLEKLSKLNERNENLKIMFEKLSVGYNLSVEQKEFCKKCLPMLINSKNPDTLKKLFEIVGTFESETIKNATSDVKQCRNLLRGLVEDTNDYESKKEILMKKLYDLSGYENKKRPLDDDNTILAKKHKN